MKPVKTISPNSFRLEDFTPFTPDQSQTLTPLLARYRLCDYSFVNLCTWGPSYDIRGAMAGDRLLILYGGGTMLFFPVGPAPDLLFLETLSRRMEDLGGRGHFVLGLREEFEKVEELVTRYDPIEDLEDANYVYPISRLAALEGRKLRKKRNYVSQFRRNYPGSTVRPLGEDDLCACLSLSEKWYASRPGLTGDELGMERIAMKTAFDNFKVFGLNGAGLFHAGRMCGFAIFSRQAEDMAMIHFEKYDPTMQGASQTNTWELARYLDSLGFRFMNREQDLGLLGLRRAKMSWDPCEILCPSILAWRETRHSDRPWEVEGP